MGEEGLTPLLDPPDPQRTGRMTDPDRPFRIPQSTLYAAEADEFDEYGWTDLPHYSDFRGSFYKTPWAVDEDAIRAADADVAIVGAPYDERRRAPAPGSAPRRSAARTSPPGAPGPGRSRPRWSRSRC